MNTSYCVIHEFLSANLFRRLVTLVAQRQGLFRSNRQNDGGRVLDEFGALKDPLSRALLEAGHDAAPRFDMPSFVPRDVEMHVTSLARCSGTGLAIAGDPGLAFVLFMHREPRAFDGGALHLRAGVDETVFEPSQNSIILFPDFVQARAGAVRAASVALVDSRLTLEGRIRT